ncbi:MAG: hypothetical protein IJU69_06110 [Bacteroidales bacterium]|nr:hypothetical protein [Bacteroidales bacterium]
MLPLQPFTISLRGLKKGKSRFDWHADAEFFGSFENTEIKDADLQIAVEVDNQGDSVEISCSIDGTVTVICDRCVEDLVLPVHTAFDKNDGTDLNQDIYDYVCTSLPLQRVHPEGGCNPETLKYLNK